MSATKNPISPLVLSVVRRKVSSISFLSFWSLCSLCEWSNKSPIQSCYSYSIIKPQRQNTLEIWRPCVI